MRRPRTSWPLVAVIGIALSVFAVAGSASDRRVLVSRLASGLVCGQPSKRHVCFQTDTISITGESTCVYDGQPAPCTWYGYSFDYQLPVEQVTLQCVWSSSARGDVGNPSGEVGRGVDQGRYELSLSGTTGHFFNPQYSLLPAESAEPGKAIRIKNSCSYRGEQLFEVVFNLRYPER